MKVWYIIKGNRIKSCIEDENGYYVLKDIWVFKEGINKRPNIKQILKEPHVIDFSYRNFLYSLRPTSPLCPSRITQS